MKICFFTHNLNQDNGAGVFSSRLIRGLAEFETVAFTHEELLPLWRFFGQLEKIRKCDLIHALDAFPYGILAAFAGILFNKKVIITAVGTGAINRLYHPFYAPFLKWAYQEAAAVTAVSNFTKKEILKKIPDLKIEVITHGVDFENFQFPISNFQTNIEKYKPYILSVGALRWRKGYKFSVKAFAEVGRRFPDLKYLIVGKRHSEVYLKELKQLIEELNLAERVFVLTDVPSVKIYEFYREAELFCLLSQSSFRDVEGFGLVFLEAAAAGLPVVGPKSGGVEDAVWEGKNGLLVPERDFQAFAGAIIKILENPELKKEMSGSSLELAGISGWDKKTADYVEIYKTLLK